MKPVFILFALFFSLPAQAEDPSIKLTCVTEYPTTSFVISTEGKEVVARVFHHNGAQYAPAISGIFTPNDLEILGRRAALVKKMKNDTTFRWPLEKCRRHDEFRFECFGTDDVQEGIGGAKIQPFALYTTKRVEEGIAGRQETLLVNMSFQVDGQGDPNIEMEYPKGFCVPLVNMELLKR